MLQQWRAVGNSMSELTGLRFEPQTFCSKDESVTTRPTGQFSRSPQFIVTSLLFLADTCGECANGHCVKPNYCECNKGYRKVEEACQSMQVVISLLKTQHNALSHYFSIGILYDAIFGSRPISRFSTAVCNLCLDW